MFNIFATLNNSLITNGLITITLYTLIAYLIIDFTAYAIADICRQRKARVKLLLDINGGLLTKKQLIVIARQHQVKYSRISKSQL